MVMAALTLQGLVKTFPVGWKLMYYNLMESTVNLIDDSTLIFEFAEQKETRVLGD